MAEYPELLFFDTFSHGNAQELNLDLVQFTNPVYVTEIRVIPLGARVQADFPGGVRLGATNPSEFSVEFFVNDLSLPGATTFQNLGVLEYNQNGPIHYKCDNKQIPTDGLILRGWYTTVTLAVYGFITKTRPPPSNLVSQPNIPPTAETPPLRVISEHKTAQWVQQHAQVYHKESGAYDVKDLSYEEETPEWPQENSKGEENKTQWEKDESAKKSPTQDERKPSRKRNSDPLNVKVNHRHSPSEKKLTDRDVESDEHKKSEDKKSRVEKPYRSSPSKLPKLCDESENKLESSHQADEKSPVKVPEPIELVEPVKEELLEKVDSPEVVKNEPEPEPEPEPAVDPVVPAPLVSLPLAPEDVEMISDEEISEEEVDSPSMSGMQVMDEVNDVPAETLVLSAQEDSLDMDQFEPILSGSSDIESEDDLNIQDSELDPNDLVDEPNKIFDPFLFEIQPLMSMKPLQMTNYEWKLLQPKVLESVPATNEKSDKFQTLLANIELKQFEEGMDDWVTTVENLIPVLEVGLVHCQCRAVAVDQLIKLVNVGLSFEKAYNQPKPVFKVRHLKAGIHLAEMLCRCNEEITVELIKTIDLQNRLLDLYEKEHLALSVKLAILKTLDITLNYGDGVKHFVSVNNNSGYRRLVRILYSTPTIRVRYSLTNLLRKVHLYETLENVSIISENENVTTEEVEAVSMCLEEVIRYLHEAPFLISQPSRFLPICSRFEFPFTNQSSYFAVHSYFVHFNFLELLATVITVPQFATDSHIVACVLEILAEFLDSERGLIYLASQWAATNRILKILSNIDDQYMISPQLGLHLAHRLYVLNLIDNFNYKWQVEQVADIDNSQLLDILSSLYYLTFTALGRHSIIHVLSRGDIIKPLLRALQYSHNAGRERRKSPGKAYIVDLVWLVVKGTNYVPFLKRHYRDLIEITSWQSDLNNSAWLNPVRNGDQSFSFDDVTELCDYLKKHTEKVTTFPGELITALRILRYLGVPPANRKCEDEDEISELKYKYVLIQIFAQEGLTFMTLMLHKICNHYERPHLHSYTLAGKEGTSMMAVLMPILQIMRALLEYVIRCRDIEFKDLTAVSPLIKTFCLLHSTSPTSPIHAESVEGSKEIVETLLVYTQMVAIEPMCDTRSLNKSLWTSMISEILKYSISVPEMFVPCLTLLSELLPLPFPIQTRVALSEMEVSLITVSRKLWSAHLLPLDGALLEMISTFCYSSYQPLLQLLKRVCVQLADLGPPTALVVARSILNSVWSELSNCERNITSNGSRLLGILACLLTHPSLKMTVIQITVGSSKTDEIFSEFWPTLLKYLSQPAEGNVYHVQAQEFIISSIQSLCDIEVSLHPPPSQSVSLETYLSNSLPPKNLFRSACEALITHMQNPENTFSTLSATLRACTTLLEYNYGVYRLKTCLSEHSGVLWNVVRKLATEWNRENPDCISCLTNLLDFFKSCISSSGTPEVNANLRTLIISAFELVEYLKWSSENTSTEGEKHPLLTICALLLECGPEEELFQTLRSDVNSFIETLNAAREKDDAGDPVIETILDPPDSLLAQFQARLVYLVGDVDDERLSVAYWLTMTPLDELEQETELVTCNLDEIANACIPNLKLDNELGRLGHREAHHTEQSAKKSDTIEPIEIFECKPTQAVLVKPAKPRSFIRPIIGPHRNDAFRSRIPNSSRAPSLHVDDFIALEKHNQQQAAAGYNRLTVKHQGPDILSAARNRSLSFLQDRTSHFHSPFRPNRGILNSWHPLLAAEQATRTVVKTQPPSVMRHPASATPLMIRGADLMRFSLSLSRWPSPPLRPPPVPQIRHLPPPHSSLHRHLRPPPPSF